MMTTQQVADHLVAALDKSMNELTPTVAPEDMPAFCSGSASALSVLLADIVLTAKLQSPPPQQLRDFIAEQIYNASLRMADIAIETQAGEFDQGGNDEA